MGDLRLGCGMFHMLRVKVISNGNYPYTEYLASKDEVESRRKREGKEKEKEKEKEKWSRKRSWFFRLQFHYQMLLPIPQFLGKNA